VRRPRGHCWCCAHLRLSGISLPLITNVIPRKTHVTVVVGQPIAVTKNAQPTDEQVDRVLQQYIDALQALYAKYGPLYNEPATKPALEVL
jgi:hypothetical protein